jgi:MbtH protein
MEDDEDGRVYSVVINDEEQYSIWLDGRPIPDGWRGVGKTGLKAECLAYIDEVWTDMRPLSLRRYMEAQAQAGSAPPAQPAKPG